MSESENDEPTGARGDDEERSAARESEDQEATRKSGMAYAAGLTIFFSVAAMMGVGWVLDRWLGTKWLMVAGIILGAVVGLYEFIRIISKMN